MQHFDFSVGPGKAQQISVQGSYVYYLSGNAGGVDDTITLRNLSGSDEVILRPGQSFSLGFGDTNVQWLVGNYKGEGVINGRLLMGAGEFSDNRISGSVEVIDGGKARALSGSAFMTRVGVASVAGQYANAQLLNPAGSGVNVFLNQILATVTSASGILISANNAPMSTFSGYGVSKDLGGTAGKAAVYTQSAVSVPSQVGALVFADLAGGLYTPIKFAEPILIRPGRGLMVAAFAIAVALNCSFEYIEEKL